MSNDSSNARMDQTIEVFERELKTLRAGRANAAIFDRLRVDYYGNPTPIQQMATISVPESRLVVIQPWDKSTLSAIEKAISSSDLSLNPKNDGKLLRIIIPPLTEKRRQEYVKMAKDMAENAKVSIRNIRRQDRDAIKKQQKDGEITQDDERESTQKLQKLTDRYINAINELLQNKEKELITV